MAGRRGRSPRCTCRAPGTPTWSARRSTSSSTCATSSSAPPRARPPRASPAAGVCKAFLRALGVERALARDPDRLRARTRARAAARGCGLRRRRRARPCAAWTREASKAMVREIDTLRKANESLGGVFEVQAFGLVPGLGSHVSWEERLDGRLAMAICSIQAIKGASIGDALRDRRAARLAGPRRDLLLRGARLLPRDQPRRRPRGRHDRRRAADRARRDEAAADADQAAALGRHRDARAGAGAARAHRLVHGARRRAWSGEAMVAFVLADAYRRKFGGDHIDDVLGAVGAYTERIGWHSS